MPESLMSNEVKSPTVEGLMLDNNVLIQECIEKANRFYSVLTSDNYPTEKTEVQVTCILSDLMLQKENLKKLNEILKTINTNIFEGGK